MGRPRPVPGLCVNWLGSDQVVLPHRACFCLPKLQWERQYPPDGGGGKGDWSDVGASSLYTVCAVCVPAAHCLFWTWNKCSGESGIQALYPLVIEFGGGGSRAKCYLFSYPVSKVLSFFSPCETSSLGKEGILMGDKRWWREEMKDLQWNPSLPSCVWPWVNPLAFQSLSFLIWKVRSRILQWIARTTGWGRSL